MLRFVPIATDKQFRGAWLPIAEAADLKWVPLFQAGVPIAKACLSEVILELTEMKSLAQCHEGFPLERLQSLMDELQGAISSPVSSTWIG